MSKTVREIAEMLGVSKPAITKYMSKSFRKQYTTKDGNRLLIDDAGIADIKEHFANSIHTKSKSNQKVNENLSESNRKVNDNQQKVIDAKDKTIAILEQQLEEATKRAQNFENENRKLNDKIAGFAEDYKNLLDTQQTLTARSQELEHEAHDQRKKLESAQKELEDSSSKEQELQQQLDEADKAKTDLQDQVDKAKNASLWQRITKKWDR